MVVASLAEQFDMCYKKIFVTHDGIDALVDLPITKRHILFELRKQPCTLTELIARVRANRHEYKHVKLEIFVKAITEMISSKYVSFK